MKEFEGWEFAEISSVSFNKKIAFVDGGQALLVHSPELVVGLVRVVGVVYEGLEKKEVVKWEGEVSITPVVEGDFMRYDAEVKGMGKSYSFNAEDKRLRLGVESADIGFLLGVVRKLLEWEMMVEVMDKVVGGFVVRDGDLAVRYPYEEELFEKIRVKGEQLGVGISGISKTSKLLDRKGRSLLHGLVERYGSWVATGEAMVVKLHPDSKYVFVFDCLGEVKEIVGILRQFSRDISVLGYPYGLFEADRLARVGNHEKEYFRVKKRFTEGNIERLERSLDFHSVLDGI